MKRSTISLSVACAGAVLLGSAAIADQYEPTRAEQRAERMLAGKVAGEPVQCVERRHLRTMLVPNSETILYRRNSERLYMTRISGGPCPGLTDDRSILIRRASSSHLCAGDQIEVIDTQTGVEHGMCALGEFVPYRSGD